MPRRLTSHHRLLAAVGLALLAESGLTSGQTSGPLLATTVDVVVLDREGRPADSLNPGDFSVRVDGRPRKVLWVRRVSRGPGAITDASARLAASDAARIFAAEPTRNVLVVVDQSTLARGDERMAVQAAGALLDRLGIDDRLAVLRVPMSSDTRVALTTERPEAREALGRVVGEAMRATDLPLDRLAETRAQAGVADPDRDRNVDPDRARVQEQLVTPPDIPAAAPDADPTIARGPLGALVGIIQALRSVPGRKVIALFSAGVLNQASSQVNEVVVAAAAAHVTVYAFGLPASRDSQGAEPSVGQLEALARATGGSYVTIGGNPERIFQRLAAELSVCHVLGLEPVASDADGRQHALRVETTLKGVTLRSPSSLVARADADDIVPPPPTVPVAAGVRIGPASDAEKRAAPSPAREAELQMALARLVDYVSGYERQYSALVAEEDYEQTLPKQRVRLRSDFLLVKPEEAQGWISFRDVYDVDGRPVRDRVDRLKRLFLDPSPEARARLLAIREESARYNIGPVERNINVPLYPLFFLNETNRPRFQFKLAGDAQAAGVSVWRVEYLEQVRPTLIADRAGHDVLVRGWFLVEKMTGAIVETGLSVRETSFTGEIVVRYRRDPALGMWVPEQMKESYQARPGTRWPISTVPSVGTTIASEAWTTTLDGQAKYSNFRRFQVKTEEKITIPK